MVKFKYLYYLNFNAGIIKKSWLWCITYRYRKHFTFDYQILMWFELQNSNKKEYKHYFTDNQYVNNFIFANFLLESKLIWHSVN